MGTSVLDQREETNLGGTGHGNNGAGGGDGSEPGGGAAPPGLSTAGIWVGIAAIVMFFAALTAAWVTLRSAGRNWTATALPGIVYVNSVVLLISSLTLEFSRGSLAAGLARRFLALLYVTLLLGVGFIVGQIEAWRELVHRGIYLTTFPSSSFFYVLTAAHGLHVLGGIIALSVAAFQGPKMARGLKSTGLLDVTAVYWHFMYGLWMYILLLMVLQV